MKRDGKLSLALHALAHMAAAGDRALTSEAMAAHFGTNPVVVRRVLGLLRGAGFVRSGKGHAGGWRLARPPEAVTAAEVRRALGGAPRPPAPVADGCVIARTLREAVEAAEAEAEAALDARLAAVTLLDLCAGHGVPPAGSPLPPAVV